MEAMDRITEHIGSTRMKALSLFSGIGGFDLAAEWVGIEVKQMVEINTFCQKVLNKNFPSASVHGDIKTYNPPSDVFDLVFGGFPCQDVSIAGKQLGVINGKRSSLFYELLRVFKKSGATFLILENVLGLLRNGFGEVLRSLSESGMSCEWETISASALGAPHRRDRIFLIAYPTGLQFSKEPSPWADQVGCQAAIASTYPNSASSQGNGSAERSIEEPTDFAPHPRFSPWSSIKPPIRLLDDGFSDRMARYYGLTDLSLDRMQVLPSKTTSSRKQGERENTEFQLQGVRESSSKAEERLLSDALSEIQEVWRSFTNQSEGGQSLHHEKRTFWEVNEPPDCGIEKGSPDRINRLAALGNAIVPQCAVIPLLRVKYLAGLIK
jgi:DNA (cytosine-5)-methyltransferase 1